MNTQIEAAKTPAETDDQRYQRLAALTLAEYDRCRETEAKQAGVRVSTLDREVARRRRKNGAANGPEGARVAFEHIEPWPSTVNGAEFLNEIAVIVERFVVAPVAAIVAASLFVLHTYAFDLGNISPILFITSPTKRCGKSRLLAILSRLFSRPVVVASATAAGIYRTIELHHPTLCIDEVDTFLHREAQLRGLINAGHTRDAAFHLGCAPGANGEPLPRFWSTWTPKIFSGIGSLADTIEDRAIIIKTARRRRNEPCERLPLGTRFNDIPRKAIRFVNDHAEAIREGKPALPKAFND